MFQDVGIANITEGSKKVRISVDDTALDLFLLIGLEGVQPYRTQIDVALDETAYTLGAGRALGNQTFGLIAGPFKCNDDNQKVDDIISKLTKMRTTSSRRIRITVPGQSNTQFSGVISSFNIKLDDTMVEGSYYILVTVTAVGMWS